MEKDNIFEMAASSIRFGSGATKEVGMDFKDMGAKRVMVLTDPNLTGSVPVCTALESLNEEGVEYSLFDRVRVEPTDGSFAEAIEFGKEGAFDAFLAIGGGSTMDTAKATNLYTTHPAPFFDYVNAPIGKGLPVPGPVKPLVAIPTTAGTGSETTGVAIFDYVALHAKTGIAHRYLKPTLGILDPDNTLTLPPAVAASCGLDVLSHALESYTALPFDERPRPGRPIERPAYQGSNPISDIWALEALGIVARYLPRVFADAGDEEARAKMILAAALAGIGFGNAGVHLPHGMSYAVASMVKEYTPSGYAVDRPLVPHGIAVILNAPAVFRYTAQACPERHLEAVGALGVDVGQVSPKDAGRVLSDRIIEFMHLLEIPNGLAAIGYRREDIPGLVKGTLPQHRVTKLSPRAAGEDDLSKIFEEALNYW